MQKTGTSGPLSILSLSTPANRCAPGPEQKGDLATGAIAHKRACQRLRLRQLGRQQTKRHQHAKDFRPEMA